MEGPEEQYVGQETGEGIFIKNSVDPSPPPPQIQKVIWSFHSLSLSLSEFNCFCLQFHMGFIAFVTMILC